MCERTVLYCTLACIWLQRQPARGAARTDEPRQSHAKEAATLFSCRPKAYPDYHPSTLNLSDRASPLHRHPSLSLPPGARLTPHTAMARMLVIGAAMVLGAAAAATTAVAVTESPWSMCRINPALAASKLQVRADRGHRR